LDALPGQGMVAQTPATEPVVAVCTPTPASVCLLPASPRERNDAMSDGKAAPPRTGLNWSVLLWVLLVWLTFSVASNLFFGTRRLPVSYTDFKKTVKEGKVREVTVKGKELRGAFNKPLTKNFNAPQPDGEGKAYQEFRTTLPSFADPDLLPLLERHHVTIRAEKEEASWFWAAVVSMLPWLLIAGFIIYSSKKFQERMGGKGGPFGFAKSKAKLYDKTLSRTTFQDVAGLSNTKKELQEVVDFLKEPSKYRALGGELPKGVLLAGPPGTGKTLMARAVAGEANVPFFSISGSEFIEMFVGVGASRVRDMFKDAKKNAPSIIFVDELDSIGRVRGTGLGGGHDEREQTLNQILSEMDGFEPHESVVVLAATNRPDILDPALIRPGRFDRQISLELPRKKAREKILRLHSQEVPLADEGVLKDMAERTVGFSGADLKNLVNEAVLLAARKGKKKVEAVDFEQGRDKIILGVEREDIMGQEEKKKVSVHEAGHALLSILLPHADPLEKATIVPRGRSLGATEQIPEEDRHTMGYRYLVDRIGVMLGGRAAEKVTYDEIGTGAGDDLKKATQLVRRMVCQWGMSEKLGPMTFRQGEPHPFLGREMAEPKDFSEATAQLIDEEIRRILMETESRAVELLESHREILDAVAGKLLEEETLTREEIEAIMEQREKASSP